MNTEDLVIVEAAIDRPRELLRTSSKMQPQLLTNFACSISHKKIKKRYIKRNSVFCYWLRNIAALFTTKNIFDAVTGLFC